MSPINKPPQTAGPPRTVPLRCDFQTNDPGIAGMLNMIEGLPHRSSERETMIGHLHLQLAALAFQHAGEYRVRERDLEMRRRRKEEQ